ncbi:RNA polymerase sigma factor [Eudoraea algarum]|uniref:RNA polymerase sigma factor n=1 Tax=Eudoraea algarum TaxID=3417568 RepID=UPI003F5D5252
MWLKTHWKMQEESRNIPEEVDHLYRREYGKLVAVLTKTFGVNNIELAEDVVQEAMLEALRQWAYTGVPENAMGWIYKVAKYKAVNLVNREKYKRAYTSKVVHHLQSEWTLEPALDHIFTDREIADDQLRMMFTCCHPSVSKDSQVALTLKTLCGFSIPEIAKAFLTTNENINKRLVRARKSIQAANIPFEVPTGKDLEPRLASIMEVIYLLFNEGYHASSGQEAIRYELCEEAIRLAEMVASNPNIVNTSQISALLALMSFNVSRFASRTDTFGNLVDLEHQDRDKWDQALIQKGLRYLSFAAQHDQVSLYHILATISAHHCTAKDFGSTNWEGILSLYDNLVLLDDSPIVQLNRAVVLAKTANAREALMAIEGINDITALQSYMPYYTVRAELHFQIGEVKKASELLKKALGLSPNKKAKSDILDKLKKIDDL